MNPGRFDRRVTIQTRTLTKDAAGGRVETWADAFDCWAQVVNQRQAEQQISDSDRNTETRVFRIRYKSGLASGTHRVLYQLRFFDITGISEEGRSNTLLLECRAIQSLSV